MAATSSANKVPGHTGTSRSFLGLLGAFGGVVWSAFAAGGEDRIENFCMVGTDTTKVGRTEGDDYQAFRASNGCKRDVSLPCIETPVLWQLPRL